MEKKGLGSIWARKKSYTKTFGLVGGGPILQIGGVLPSFEDNAQDKWKSLHCEINSQSTNTRYSRG